MNVSSRADILFLAHRIPFPLDKGDRIRSFHLLKWLSARARVHLACLADEPAPAGWAEALGRYCVRTEVVPLGHRSRWVRAGCSLVQGRTVTEGAFDSPALHRMLRLWAGGTRFQAALASASSMVPYLRRHYLRDVPAVIDLVDVDSQKWFDYAEEGRGPRAWLYRTEGRRLRRLEQSLPDWARAVTLVSAAEAKLYRRSLSAPGSVHAISNGVALDDFRPRPEADEDGRDCVFVGALDYRPNVDGACWFCREVWPEVQRAADRVRGSSSSVAGPHPLSAA